MEGWVFFTKILWRREETEAFQNKILFSVQLLDNHDLERKRMTYDGSRLLEE
jgi:hypothetical protein